MAPLIGGSIAIIAGVLLIVYRRSAARWNRRALRRQFGRLANSAVANSTPANMLVVGVGAVALGAWLIAVRPGT